MKSTADDLTILWNHRILWWNDDCLLLKGKLDRAADSRSTYIFSVLCRLKPTLFLLYEVMLTSDYDRINRFPWIEHVNYPARKTASPMKPDELTNWWNHRADDLTNRRIDEIHGWGRPGISVRFKRSGWIGFWVRYCSDATPIRQQLYIVVVYRICGSSLKDWVAD